MAIELSCIWCGINFYIFLQHSRETATNRERSAFKFQIFSFISLSLVLGVIFAIGNIKFPAVVGSIALHGIYSLSVLEIWSLTQGSYSLNLLSTISKAPVNLEDLTKQFVEIAADKKKSRTDGLIKAGFIRPDLPRSLTIKGLIAVKMILIIRKFAGFRNAG